MTRCPIVADVVNKVGFGPTAYFAIKAMSGDDQLGGERLDENADTGRDASA